MKPMTSVPGGRIRIATLAFAALLIVACGRSSTPSDNHTGFESSEAALTALVAALEAGDTAQLGKIFGPGSEEMLSSGDPVDDASDRAAFLGALQGKACPRGAGRRQRGPAGWR